MASGVLILVIAISGLAAPPATVSAVQDTSAVQDSAQAQAPGQAQSGEAVYRRERFVYPTDGRRNPFVSLLTLEDVGPQFESLDLVGVIYGGSYGSVATLIDRATDKRYRIRRGDAVGNARVVEIRPDAVVFQVTQFGVTRSETLSIRKEEEEEQG